jgi:hypothetical protein
VPIKQIAAYEKGERIKTADMPKLARALFVSEADINWVSVSSSPPRPRPGVEKPQKPKEMENPPQPKQKKEKRIPSARPSQIEHALLLAAKIGDDETAVTAKAGKPLTELNLHEASALILEYQRAWMAYKETQPAENQSKRAVTPEAVDRYETEYLQARQEAGDEIAFTLFDGSVRHGRVTGFSPYAITIQQPDGVETTLQKLGIAYYSVIGYRLQE